ncbi:MAG: ExbD/TolR family protein [Myxococcota bacterium]
MRRQSRSRRHHQEMAELDMTTFLNLMVVLVPFLLITAVFSRITIVELTLPTAAGNGAPVDPGFRVEVIVRDSGIELSNAKEIIAAVPKVDGEYDLATVSEMMMALKQEHPDSTDASVLLEPDIEYDHLIRVMDVVRSAVLPAKEVDANAVALAGSEQTVRVALFTDISIGDAP